MAHEPGLIALDQLRISVESPLAQALLGRRAGEQVDVGAPAGRYQCRILTTRRHRAAASRGGHSFQQGDAEQETGRR